MTQIGDVVYLTCRSSSGDKPVSGWIVELGEGEIVIATSVKAAEGLSNKLEGKSGDTSVAFLRVPSASATESQPSNWTGPRVRELPGLGPSKTVWEKVGKKELGSSDAGPAERPPRASRRSPLEADLDGLGKLFAAGRDDEDEDDDEEDDDEDLPSFLPPGQSAKKVMKKPKKANPKGTDMRQLLRQGLASGESVNSLLPVMMMTMLLDRDEAKKKKHRGEELLGGSSSDDSDGDFDLRGKGMKAVSTLNRLHEQIRKKPKRIVQLFEKEIIEELGIVPGQAWTVRDYVRRQPWGKFKGIQRCAVMDCAVYELLRTNQPEAATAQLVQNLKAKVQSVLAGGDWQASWLLTGLPDPLARKEFAGSKEEMAIISGYMEALAGLKKKIKESSHAGADQEEEASGSTQK